MSPFVCQERVASWNQHVGSIWTKLLLGHDFSSCASVLEIGPGFADKIGLALRELSFQGTIYVVEQNRKACEWVHARYQSLLPRAQVVVVNAPVHHACGELPRRIHCVLLNHVLDDMIIRQISEPKVHELIFGHEGTWDARLHGLRMADSLLLANRHVFRTLRVQVLGPLDDLLAHARPKLIGACQYESWFHLEHGLARIDEQGRDLLREFAGRTRPILPAEQSMLRLSGMEPDWWMIGEPVV